VATARARSILDTTLDLRHAPLGALARPLLQRRHEGVRGCVLLVDSDRSIVVTYTRAIRSARMEVVSILTGQEALTLAHRVQFDLLLLHLKLDDIPTVDLVRALRQQGIETPFIAIGACLTDPLAREMLALGADRVLAEPLRLAELREAAVRATRQPVDVSDPPTSHSPVSKKLLTD
jgi:DNA-binding response OmpR family regulator